MKFSAVGDAIRRDMLRAAVAYADARARNLTELTDESLLELALAERRVEELAIAWVGHITAALKDPPAP